MLRAGAVLVASLAMSYGCGSSPKEPAPLEPMTPLPGPSATTTRTVPPATLPTTTVTTLPTTTATAPSDHHAAPPRRTGP